MKSRFLISFLLVATYMQGIAQPAFVGIWEGKLDAGIELHMIFHFSQNDEKKLIATIDCPEQSLKNIAASSVIINADSIFVEVDKFHAKYSGKLKGDSITGLFEQGMSLPLNLGRIMKVEEKKRPQTPIPPFPYKSENIVYKNKDSSVSYGATITIPEGKGPFPAVLLITGSGQQNRDEEIMEHKPFAVIADYLTRNGIVVLRVDDRGIGQTTGSLLAATTRDFTNDAITSLGYLKSRKEVDKTRIGLIGHSEGGMIAQMIAAERNDIDFIVMLAGPGEKITSLMTEQNEAILSKSGLTKEYIDAYLDLYKKIVSVIIEANQTDVTANVTAVLNTWLDKTTPDIAEATTGIKDEGSKKQFVKQFVYQLNSPWFRYFLAYDPSINLKKITSHVLALNGDKDIQVISKTNLAAMEASFKKGHAKSYEIKEFPGLNHLFQECRLCTVNEYGQLEQTISPIVLETMGKWLKKIL